MRTASNRIISISLVMLLAFFSLAIMFPSGTEAGCPTSRTLNTIYGPVYITNSGLCILGSTEYPTNNMPCSVPGGYVCPFGMFKFSIELFCGNSSGTITVTFPNALPAGAKFFNCVNGRLVDFTNEVRRVDQFTTVFTFVASGDYTWTLGYPIASATPQSSSPWLPETAKAPVQLSNISVKKASLSSVKVTPGEKVTVTADIANTGTGNGTSNIKVYINGAEEGQQGVSVSSGGTTTVIFDVTRSEPGTYTVYVGSTNAGSFTVDQFTPNTILYISGALVFFALVIGVIWMTRRKS